ncbi:hypothetical protein QQF64_025934 [Cirrhinus molitorella]|uniref:LisH domain-containing protein n=1 Tax=Cirrhinus molitorella TaxID=172907 RepID=A0ABR3NRM4_9TELE
MASKRHQESGGEKRKKKRQRDDARVSLAVKREIKEVIYKHLVENGVLPEVREVGVADQLPVSVGEGAEYPKTEEMAGMDPINLPSPTDPRLTIRLKEVKKS